MDFTVEVGGPGVMLESPPSGPAPNPAGEEARAEYSKVMNDPTHPLFEDFKRGGKQSDEYVNALYRKMADRAPVPIKTESLSLGPVEPKEGETPEEARSRARNEVILAPLKQEWGTHYEARMATVPGIVSTLFEDMGEVYHELGARVRMTYGPKGEAATLKYFAELHDIKQGG